jgi:hypothetical protein
VNISLKKFCCRKETWGYAKEKVTKRKKEKRVKNGHKDVRSIGNNGYKDVRHEKKRDSPCSCKYLKFQQERDVFKEHS